MSAAGQPPPVSGDQFYVTHCTTADSVLNAPGYSVRASSASDPDVLRRALEYPPYELPLDMWREKPTKAQAPRRLARTMHPNGGTWVVHSVYLEKDTMNRDRSYFSHLLQLPAADPAAVLESWDADTWLKEYPPNAPKSLKRGSLPKGTRISPTALVAFLTGPQAGPTDLASVVCPQRLRADPAARRALVGRFLRAVVLVAEANAEDDPRARLFVHAEPGLTAMLLYAAVRILPAQFTDDLTFSTFEPAHRSIRDYRLATVVGTYLGLAGKGLDPDLGTTRGFALDTIVPERSSPELAPAAPLPAGLNELIDLAAAGAWDLLEDAHRLAGSGADALGRVAEAVPLARALAGLNRGTPTTADLIALKRDRRGPTFLAQKADKVWAYLKDAALADPALRAEFRDWLADPNRLAEYRREACEALVRGDFDSWDARWGLMRECAEPGQLLVQAEKAQKSLDKHLPTLPMAARDRLRGACLQSGAWPDHHLLAPTSPDELNALLAPNVPAGWQGYTCFAVIGPDKKNWLLDSTKPFRAAMRERARKHLMAAPPAVLEGYVQSAKPYVSSDPEFVYDLLRPFRPECRAFLSRLIDVGANQFEAADWAKLLGDSDLDLYGVRSKNWEGFLLQNDNLAKLLGGFKDDEAAGPIWDAYLGLLSAELLDGDEFERKVYDQLDKGRRALGAAGVALKDVVAPGGARKLKAADTLLAVKADPKEADALGPNELADAFRVFGIEPLDGLRKIYLAGNLPKLDLNADAAGLSAFVDAFRSCYPITTEWHVVRTAVDKWLDLSASCPSATRAAFQAYLVREFVPQNWHQTTLEAFGGRFLPEAEARIREGLAVPERKPGEKYARPAPRKAESATDLGFASEATKRARRTKGERNATRRRRRDDGVPPWVWLVVLGVVAVVAAVVVVWKLGGSDRPKPQDADPPANKGDGEKNKRGK